MKKAKHINSNEITDKETYLNRRTFIRAAILAGTATATTIVYRSLNPVPAEPPKGQKLEGRNLGVFQSRDW